MAQLNPDRYVKIGTVGPTYGSATGVYWDKTNSQICLAIDGTIVARADSTGITADLEFSSEARGDILRRGATAWAAYSAKTSGQILVGDGTDIASVAVSGDVALTGGGVATVTDLTIASEARGDLLRRGASTWERFVAKTAGSLVVGDGTDVTTLAIGSAGKVLRVNAGATAPTWTDDCTNLDFTTEREVAIFAKTTGAIKTAANAQQDFFWVGSPPRYFELAQGVGALGANTLLAANGLTPGATGWLLTLDDTATDSMEITEGIVLGSARSFTIGTSAAFKLRCAFLITTRANITHLLAGFRVLGAYVTASTLVEAQTAYPDKAMIGVSDNAGVLSTETSLNNSDVHTALAHAAAANGDILALEVLVSGAGVVTYKLATATPAGGTAAQTQAAVTTAYAALATDANAVALTLDSTDVVVPSIIIGASGAGAPDVRLVNYFCGLQ